MALAAYEKWMALEQCEKYRLIRDERSAEEAEVVRAKLVMGDPYEGVMHTRAMMAHVGEDYLFVCGRVFTLEEQEEVRAWVWDDHLSVGGRVVTLEEQEEVMRLMMRVGDKYVGGRVVTLKEQEAVMHVMALEQYWKCLEVQVEALGQNNHASRSASNVANTYNNLAGVYKTQGKYEMALMLYERCLKIRIEMYGEEHVDVAYMKVKLAEVHTVINRAVLRTTRDFRTVMNRAVLRATRAVLRRATRAERRATQELAVIALDRMQGNN
jgi:tetratricopeptide (TPR) repeat protein